MTGRLSVTDAKSPRAPHTHAVFALASGRELRYVDPRRFGLMRVYPRSEAEDSDELTVLGLDPFDARFTAEYLEQSLGESRRDIKAFLMDQSRIAGLGNIYVCEALFHSRIAPTRIARRLCKRAAALHAAILHVLNEAISNRGTSFRDFVDADGAEGDNEHYLFVYGREGDPCRRCKARIRRLVQGGRSTFFCPRCQK
jgi:formamidopyrimidine-DNA glycosylase